MSAKSLPESQVTHHLVESKLLGEGLGGGDACSFACRVPSQAGPGTYTTSGCYIDHHCVHSLLRCLLKLRHDRVHRMEHREQVKVYALVEVGFGRFEDRFGFVRA
jgi:hypothetical protein